MSATSKTWARRELRRKNAGTARKKKEAKKSTLSAVELFAVLDQPAAPQKATASKKSA